MLRGIVFILVGLWLIVAFSGCASSCPCRGPLMGRACTSGRPCAPGATDHGEGCVDYVNQPRFFPVPTKPAFTPRDEVFSTGAETMVLEPEVIEPPAAGKPNAAPAPSSAPVSDDPQSAIPRRLDTVEGSDWVFNPPTPSTSQKVPVRTRQTTASNKMAKVKR